MFVYQKLYGFDWVVCTTSPLPSSCSFTMFVYRNLYGFDRVVLTTSLLHSSCSFTMFVYRKLYGFDRVVFTTTFLHSSFTMFCLYVGYYNCAVMSFYYCLFIIPSFGASGPLCFMNVFFPAWPFLANN